MSFDSDPNDNIESYPCKCGGSIVKNKNKHWECNACDVMYRGACERVDIDTGKTMEVRPANWIMLGQMEVINNGDK